MKFQGFLGVFNGKMEVKMNCLLMLSRLQQSIFLTLMWSFPMQVTKCKEFVTCNLKVFV